jgi:hypothetical protein
VTADNTTPWLDEIRRVLADGGFPSAPAESQHLCYEHGADPATVARIAPTPELAGRIHDAAHLYPGAPWGEVVVRAWAEAWWEARQRQYRERPEITAQIELVRRAADPQPLTGDMTETGQREPWVMEDPAEWRDFFREVLGRDMPLNAEHEARLKQLDAAELLDRDMWTNGPDGTSYLHGWNADELAGERGGLSFPHLYQQRYLQLSAAGQPLEGAPEETPGPKVSKAAARAAEIKAEAAKYGLTVTAELTHDFNPATGEWDGAVIDATVTVEGKFTPGDAQAYIIAEANANTVLGMIPMVRPGSVWGTDSASVGGHAGLTDGYVRMNKSGAPIAVSRHLAQASPPTGGGNPAAPKMASAKARKPARRRTRQHVQPRTRRGGQVRSLLAPGRELRDFPATDQAIRGDGGRPLPRQLAVPPDPREAVPEPGKAGRWS